MPALIQTAASLALAFVLGTLIGAERQYRQRSAGLRTTVLVAVGAAAFVSIGMRLGGIAGAVQIVAYTVTGVGFLGGGVIMKEGKTVRGLNTAATLWCSASVGAFSGAGLGPEALLMTITVLAGNTLLRPLADLINRTPIGDGSIEATYEVRATTSTAGVAQARDLLVETLEVAHYPVRDVTIEDRGETDVELVATLAVTTIEPDEIEAVLRLLERSSLMRDATWTSKTSD
ncbi:MgtC/SapB family protein [Lichenihabitans psoromatis]|uniref:MgtC/SapB family protein n=1 Tax=Lichenihabitans psoromatis TaxID=2528642 RepID=UPI0010368EEF|nr:MgtC/SapB family protein [Lichenihabitans psoromatis]